MSVLSNVVEIIKPHVLNVSRGAYLKQLLHWSHVAVDDSTGKTLDTYLSELNANKKDNYTASKEVYAGNYGSSWSITTTQKDIGAKECKFGNATKYTGTATQSNDYYTVEMGDALKITVKQAGLYFVSLYFNGSPSSAGNSTIAGRVIIKDSSDNLITSGDSNSSIYTAGYSYRSSSAGFSANITSSQVFYLPANSYMNAFLNVSSGSTTATTSGNNRIRVVKLD